MHGRRALATLTEAERHTLEAMCDTLMPAMEAGEGDDERLFAVSARSVGLAGRMEEALEALDETKRAQFRLLLRAFDQPATMFLLIGKARAFGALGHTDRERALLALGNNMLPYLRAGFQGLKRLSAFLFYSLTDEQGSNPTWAAIGYRPVRNRPAHGRLLKLERIERDTVLECDVCVVGSGAGGGVVAGELAEAGKRVVVLEAGSGLQAPDYDQMELRGMQQLYLDQGLTSTRDLGVAILAGATVGGGTTVNWQTSLPLPPEVREEWAAVSGCSHFRGESFQRSLDAVMQRVCATTAESAVNPNNAALRRGCEALGYGWRTIARNARGCDIEQCGSCVFGCRHGGKQSTAVTYLYDAQAKGDTVIVPNCRAETVAIADGKVQGVVATYSGVRDGERREYTVRVQADKVVVAAGSIHSPLLLMRSGVTLPALGSYLFLHPTTAVTGTYPEAVEPWSGPPQTVLSDHFARLDGQYGFRLETAPAHPGLMAMAAPWFDARHHRRTMQDAARMSAIIVLVRDRSSGRVRPGRGGSAIINYDLGAQEREHMRRGVVEAARVHIAAGAERALALHTRRHEVEGGKGGSQREVEAFYKRLAAAQLDRNRSTLFSAHQMGTCRMGSSARTAVCGPDGQVFAVRGLYVGDASAFPASSGVNPMITVMAMAHHTAQGVKERG